MKGAYYPTGKKIFGVSAELTPSPHQNETLVSSVTYEFKKNIRYKQNQPHKYTCSNGGKDSLQTCFNKLRRNSAGCILPLQKSPKDTLRTCSSYEDVINLFNVTSIVSAMSVSELTKASHCDIPCKREEYTTEKLSESAEPCPSIFNSCKGLVKVVLMIDESHISEARADKLPKLTKNLLKSFKTFEDIK